VTVPDDSAFVRAPKQERSRRSLDRVIEAAVVLLVERGSDAFTLAEVAARSGVSIGSIYARVGSKDDLLRAAQARELARMGVETRRAFDAPAPDGESLPGAVARAVRATADLLESNAAVLTPFMLLANSDPVIAEAGRAGYRELADGFREVLLVREADIRHPDPRHAADWSCAVVYAVLARRLGLGGDLAAAGEGDREQVLADLAAMVSAFLAGASAR
jgi:AcrR family transcriptional regulator